MALKQLALLSLMVAVNSPALGQTPVASQQMAVTGSVPNVCSLQQATLSTGVLNNFRGLSGDTLQIATLVDPTTLATNAATAQLEFAAVCNFPHQVRLESQNNGLWQTDGSTDSRITGFAYALPYVASITWGDVSGELNADANIRHISEQSIYVDEATAGQLRLNISIVAGASNIHSNAPVLAGVYGDTLRIFLEPR
jgi:hypothetical protein